jgi:pyrroloquinoline-quinone synthase
MNAISQLDALRRAINVLDHPFYVRWSAGEMSREELRCYVGEYRHAVVALAGASADAAACAPDSTAMSSSRTPRRRRPTAVWDRFASSAGWSRPAAPR